MCFFFELFLFFCLFLWLPFPFPKESLLNWLYRLSCPHPSTWVISVWLPGSFVATLFLCDTLCFPCLPNSHAPGLPLRIGDHTYQAWGICNLIWRWLGWIQADRFTLEWVCTIAEFFKDPLAWTGEGGRKDSPICFNMCWLLYLSLDSPLPSCEPKRQKKLAENWEKILSHFFNQKRNK